MRWGDASAPRLLLAAAWLLALQLVGCSGGEPDGALWGSERARGPAELRALPLPESVPQPATIGIDGAGRAWIGAGEGLIALDSAAGAAAVRADLELPAPRVLGEARERVYVRAGDALVTLDGAGTLRARRDSIGASAVALDPLARHVYLATDNGAVFGLDPRLLRPIWAWPRLGRATTAILSTPAGDRLFQALAAGADDEPELLVRDVQTGRVLSRLVLPGTAHRLVGGRGGGLFAVLGAEAVEIAGLRLGRGGLEITWRHRLADLEPAAAPRARVAAVEEWVAVVVPGRTAIILAAASGEPVGVVEGEPIDVVASAEGDLYLLLRDGVRVLR